MQRGKWEIWNAYFRFEDELNDGKVRPVLVIDSDNYFTISTEITKHSPRDGFLGEVPIQFWVEAGLNCPSTVRLSKVLELSDFSFANKIGKLNKLDRKNVGQEIEKMKCLEQI